jgi:ubiquitin carboxyl-terminal hydrolase L5
MAGWCTIESDPGVFTELIHDLGCTDVQLEEIWSVDQLTDTSSGFTKVPIHGLIFLFQWKQELYANDTRPIIPFSDSNGLFYAKQNVQNACATQAIIGTLLNVPDLDLGPTLSNYKDFATWVDYDMRGDLIGQQDQIRICHNSFARPEPFVSDEKKEASEDAEAFHFVAYIEKDGAVFELDGLKGGPIRIGSVSEGANWVSVAAPEIQRRCAELGADAVKFSLMAVMGNRAKQAEKDIALATERRNVIASEMAKGEGATTTLTNEDGRLASEIANNQALIMEEKVKFDGYAKENKRRRHNYVPLVVNLLKLMATNKKLLPAHERAIEKVKVKREERLSKKKAEEQQQHGHGHGGHGHSHGGEPCSGDH